MDANQPPSDDDQQRGAAGATQQRGQQVATHARDEAGSVAHEAADQARQVAGEARSEVMDVVDEARHAVHDVAETQTHTLSSSMRELGHDLEAMAKNARGSTPAPDYVSQAGRSLSSMAERLDEGGIDGALDDLRQVARRNPGVFLAGAAAAGFGLARVLRHADAPTGDGTDAGGGELPRYGSTELADSGSGELDLREGERQAPASDRFEGARR